MKKKTHCILKDNQFLKLSMGKKLENSHGYKAETLSSLMEENGLVTFFGREQHEKTSNHVPTKSFYYYFLSNNDWSKINGKLNDIYVKEESLRRNGVEEKQKLTLEEIKSFHQRIWFDLSKQSNAIEGVFADYNMSSIEFEKKLGEMIHITSPSTRVFDFNHYFNNLRDIEDKIQDDSSEKIVRGRKREHHISNELIRHYIAFKYAYKCAKMFAATNGVKNVEDVAWLLSHNPQLEKEFEGLSKQEIYNKITFNAQNILTLTNNFIALMTGKDYVGYREDQAYVTLYGDREFAGWIPVSEMRVESQMKSWADWIINENALHPIEKAAIAQAEFVRIHPFADGNGRTSRILANFILMVNDLPTIQVRGYEDPNVAISKEKPLTYFNALNVAIREHDANQLVELFKQGIEESIDCVEDTMDRIAEEIKLDDRTING